MATEVCTYLVSYDLNKPGQDYKDLFAAIKRISQTWWHHLDSTWVIRVTADATQIRDALRPFMDKNDELLVVKLTGVGAWAGIDKKGSDWLKENL